MTAIALELDQKLQSLDPGTAASVERLVRDALSWAEQTNGDATLSKDFWRKIREDWDDAPFERPAQGDFEKREDW